MHEHSGQPTISVIVEIWAFTFRNSGLPSNVFWAKTQTKLGSIPKTLMVSSQFSWSAIKIMSSRQLFACNHCNRSNFRSQGGLRQHLAKNKVCSLLHKQSLATHLPGTKDLSFCRNDASVPKPVAAMNAVLAEDLMVRAQIAATNAGILGNDGE